MNPPLSGPLPKVVAATRHVLLDIESFSRYVLKTPLYAYQLDPARAIMESIAGSRGDEILLIMSRQSGKNETVSQLLTYLLNLLHRTGGNIVYAAIGDNVGRGIRRLEEHLDNDWNTGNWKRQGRPTRRTLGKASVVFMSSHPQAHARGETAHHLLVVDELQDQDAAHLQAVFQPMRAACNATAVYLGTVRTTHDALWQKKEELERLQAQDGRLRVFIVGPDQVTAENPNYQRFLAAQISKHGRKHPLIASEYFLEPLDVDGGLFPQRRLQLMRGSHPRQFAPQPGDVAIATLDVAGIDEGTTDPTAALDNPARDYTTCTIFTISDYTQAGPIYTAVDIFTDQGSQHFKEHPDGRPSLAHQLLSYLQHWQVAHLIGDATGVGDGLLNWLASALGSTAVTPFKFTRRSKAQLGVDFLALVETNRFKYWQEEHEFDDAWWYFAQANHCTYALDPGRPLETHLQWYVPASTRISTPTGTQPLHDDRLISAALIAEADRLIRDGKIHTGLARSIVTENYDPLDDLPDW
jgi:hypothetical protein